jgi:DNA-binding NtrC family response regulator
MPHVLIVDDDDNTRDALAEIVAAEGFTTAVAGSIAEARAQMTRRRPDAVLVDIKLPDGSGMDLFQDVGALADETRPQIILITGYASIETAVEALRLGATDYLTKPINFRRLKALLSRVPRTMDLKEEIGALRGELRRLGRFGQMMGTAPAMQKLYNHIARVAPTEATVLLLGESGTGKEVAARLLHAQSHRNQGPFVAINCAALSDTLLESELFGHEKGAFTGAAARRRGRIELADGGTFFLDEVGELKLEQQAKLLRVLQERRIERLGGTSSVPINVRFIAATNRDLPAQVAQGRFRGDLYHRLAVFPIYLPPLRERRQDLPPLADALLKRIGGELGKPGLRLLPDAVAWLVSQPWLGNVRELGNTLERAAILTDTPEIDRRLLLPAGPGVAPAAQLQTPSPAPNGDATAPAAPPAITLEAVERQAIQAALQRCAGHRKQAAEQLGIGLRTLYEKLKQYGIS